MEEKKIRNKVGMWRVQPFKFVVLNDHIWMKYGRFTLMLWLAKALEIKNGKTQAFKINL